jgi:hypothetical protein
MAGGTDCRDCGGKSYGYELCAGCVGKRLAEPERVPDIVEELFPGGHYENGGR